MTEELKIEAVKFNHRQKKLKLLPRLKSISCQVCEKIFNTNNEVKKHVADKSIILGMSSALNQSSVTTVMLVLED